MGGWVFNKMPPDPPVWLFLEQPLVHVSRIRYCFTMGVDVSQPISNKDHLYFPFRNATKGSTETRILLKPFIISRPCSIVKC